MFRGRREELIEWWKVQPSKQEEVQFVHYNEPMSFYSDPAVVALISYFIGDLLVHTISFLTMSAQMAIVMPNLFTIKNNRNGS